jgi:hypothetical protein
LAAMIWLPRCQVRISVNMIAAISSVTHPPLGTFGRLATKNVLSTPRKRSTPTAIFQRAQCHRARATTRNRTVVMMNVPVTATP